MKIVITGGRNPLGERLARALGAQHEVSVAPAGHLRDEAFATQIMQGADALVHLAPLFPDLPGDASAREVLDLATRGTYVLMHAAIAAGMRRVVVGSSLRLLDAYPSSWRVNEAWAPHPDVDQ